MADECGNWTMQNQKISTKHKYEMQKIVQTQPLNPKLSLKKENGTDNCLHKIIQKMRNMKVIKRDKVR